MTAMKFNFRDAAIAGLDARTMREMAAALAALRGRTPRGQLACKWGAKEVVPGAGRDLVIAPGVWCGRRKSNPDSLAAEGF